MDLSDCAENRCLDKLYDSFDQDDEDLIEDAAYGCMEFFWPAVAQDHAKRQNARCCEDGHNSSTGNPMVKIQLVTVNGCLVKISHDNYLKYPIGGPVKNPCPESKLFSKEDVEVAEKIFDHISRSGLMDATIV